MTPNSKSRLPIYVGVWLATAVATFCLGRITSGTFTAATGGTKGNGVASGSAGDSAIAGSAKASGANGAPSDDLIARVFGSHATSLDQVLGGKSLEEHLKNLLKVDDEAVRMLGFLRLLEALSNPDDIKSALELIGKEGNGRFRVTEQSMLLQKWASMDPKSAAEFASAQRDFSRFTGMNAVLRTWLKSNPEEAIAWAEVNGVAQQQEGDGGRGRGGPGPEDGNIAIATLIGPLAQQNLDRAFELAMGQPESRARGRMIDTLVDEMLAQRGIDAVRNKIADLPDDAFRAGMAGELVGKMMQNGDPKEVAQQVWNFPSGQTRATAMGEAIRRIADNDPVAAGTILQSLGNSPDLDNAKASFSREVLRQDPSSAFVWAGTITNEQERTQTLQRLVGGLSRQDPALAQQYAAQYGVQATPQPTGGGGGDFRNFGGRRGGPGGGR